MWSPDAETFDSFADAVEHLGTKDRYFDDLAYELGMTRGELESNLEEVDNEKGLTVLMQVIQTNSSLAVKMCRSQHEANTFLRLIEQMAEKRDKEKRAIKMRGALA